MFVRNLNILLAEWIKVPMDGLPPMLDRKLHERLVFTNPDYELRHNRGEWIGNIPSQIVCLKQKGRNYLLPRGFLEQFIDLCKRFQVPHRIVDRRRYLDPAPIEFHGQLKSYQQDAAEAVLEHDCGTLVGGHKSGKTVIALYTIAQRRQPALILIPRIDLLDGWLKKIESFLQIPSSEVGVFSGGVHQVGKLITIGHSGEVMRYWRNIYDKIGYLIVDESQRSPSKVLTNLVPNFDCRYILGLSNTVERKDRLFKLIYYYLGEVVYTIHERDAREGRGIIPGKVIARSTDFSYPYQSRADYSSMLRELMINSDRNRIIANDVEAELKNGEEPVLILSGGEDHDQALRTELARRGIEAASCDPLFEQGDGGEEQGDAPIPLPADFTLPKAQVLLLSARGLSQCAQAVKSNVILLTVPVYFRKSLASAIREVSQNGGAPEVNLRIYDYVDTQVGILDNYFRMRSYNYGMHPDLLLEAGLK
ncbi:MAG: DEAD/DEAH box helicase family protein [Syntrophobacteraceae bacterium]